jgi:Rgp1
VTQVVSIPLRIFNRTNQDGSRTEFELLDPIIHTKDQAQVTITGQDPLSPLLTTFLTTPHSSVKMTPLHSDSLTTPHSGVKMTPLHSDSLTSLRSSTLSRALETDVQTNSIENVLNTLQSMGKGILEFLSIVNYDICKNNQLICQLQLPRAGFRLGESVTAVFNFSKSSIPCYHISVFLECHEIVEQEFTDRSKEYLHTLTRKCFGEFHQFVVNTQRSCVILNIPQKACPDFTCSAVSLAWSLKLEFITGIGGGVPRAYSTSSEVEGFVHSKGLSTVDVEPFDCIIPLKVFGALKTPKKQRKVLRFEIK